MNVSLNLNVAYIANESVLKGIDISFKLCIPETHVEHWDIINKPINKLKSIGLLISSFSISYPMSR